jgi:hypothetical protein
VKWVTIEKPPENFQVKKFIAERSNGFMMLALLALLGL